MNIDYDFFPVLGVPAVAGRLFARDHSGDVMPPDADKIEGTVSVGAILNRRAVQRLGFGTPAAAVGKSFQVSVSEEKKGDVTVVGVVDDMHFRSVRDEISPMMFFVADDPKQFDYLFAHVRSGDLPATLAAIDRTWAQLVPAVPVRRAFVDEEFAKLYEADEERMKMFGGFAAFAVFVACLGLFGLASFAADRRTREIGIRKVMGASVGDIVRLLLWQFSRPVLLANLIAWPAAWYFVQSWLEGFQYRIDVTPAPFLAAGGAALLIAWATVVMHARRVSMSNPVESLRYE
jgi:putative ABC transport system permease protein